MSANSLLIILVFVTFLGWCNGTARLHATSDNGGQDLVLTTCNRTLHFDLCLSSLRSDPRSKTADVKGLARVALDVGVARAAEMISQLNEMILQQNSTNPPYVTSCLQDCVKEYEEATDNLQEAIKALENNSYDSVNSLTTAAMTDSDTCEDGFDEKPEFKSPVTTRNKHFFDLCSNALAISGLLV